MDIKVTRDNLAAALGAVSATLLNRTTLPILSSVLIEATVPDGENGFIRVTATDLDTATRIQFPADVKAEGAVCVPGKRLADLVGKLAAGTVRIAHKRGRAELTSGRASFKLNADAADEFPTVPEVDYADAWTIGAGELDDMARMVGFAASTEMSRPTMNGILWQLDGESMRMVATDGHRLARIGIAANGASGRKAEHIVHPKALAAARRAFGDGDTIEVGRGENRIGFRVTGRAEVVARLIEGPYPNYNAVVPKGGDIVVTVDRDEFAAALKRANVIASDQTHRIALELVGNGEARIIVETPDLGAADESIAAHGALPAEFTADTPFRIGFNAAYLLDVVPRIPTAEVRMSFTGPERPALLEPVGADAADYLAVAMPLRLLD